jgi:hypothetical protein
MVKRNCLITLSALVIYSCWNVKDSCVNANPPLALHRVIEVEPSSEIVIRLEGFDEDGDVVSDKQ